MSLTPKPPLNSKDLNWDDLDKQLKLFIKSKDDTTLINTGNSPYSKQEIISELKKE